MIDSRLRKITWRIIWCSAYFFKIEKVFCITCQRISINYDRLKVTHTKKDESVFCIQLTTRYCWNSITLIIIKLAPYPIPLEINSISKCVRVRCWCVVRWGSVSCDNNQLIYLVIQSTTNKLVTWTTWNYRKQVILATLTHLIPACRFLSINLI
jgi:hypothetical protein